MDTRFPLIWPDGLPPAEVARRIMARCEPDDECLVWTGSRLPKGYGQIRIKTGVNWYTAQTHRAIWEAANGRIPIGLHVLHSCDNPPCCNLAHLRLGTPSDNMEDMAHKGRSHDTRNERSPRVKLTNVQILEIRKARSGGESQTSIAARYGVHPAHVSRIANGLRRPIEEGRHYEGCWRLHHDCAVAEIERLLRERSAG